MSGVSPGQKTAIQSATSLSWQTTLIVCVLLGGSIYLTAIGKVSGDAWIGLAASIVAGVLVTRGVSSGSAASTAPPPPES